MQTASFLVVTLLQLWRGPSPAQGLDISSYVAAPAKHKVGNTQSCEVISIFIIAHLMHCSDPGIKQRDESS